MYALNLNWIREFTPDDGMEALAPVSATAPGRSRTSAALAGRGPAAAAVGGVVIAVLAMLAAPFTQPLVLALGGTAAFLYLGTALVAARRDAAVLDLAAAMAAIGIAVSGAGPAISAMLVHVVWGVLRGTLPGTAPGRRFATSWAALHAMAALLLGFGV